MSTRKIFIGLFASLAIAIFAGQTLSQTRRAGGTGETPDWILQKNMTSEQINIEMQKRMKQRQMQNRKRIEQLEKQSRIEAEKSSAESMRQALRATQRQWRIIKPRLDKVKYFSKQAQVSIYPSYYRRSRGSSGGVMMGGSMGGMAVGSMGGGSGGGSVGSSNNQQSVAKVEEGWKWSKAWEKKAPSELTKGERICEELLELLEDKGSKQEEIEQKVEALREVRKEASKQLVEAQQELRKVLTFRQEATLVLMRYLD